jgi:transcriptional regulator with XRE-family HTH domain
VTDVRPVLNAFRDTAPVAGKRSSWQNREPLIYEHFPAAVEPSWSETLGDDWACERIIRDLLKHDQQEKGAYGPLPNLDVDKGMQSWRELTGQDYTSLSFHEAFRFLASDTDGKRHTLRQIAHKTGISRSRVHRLLEHRAGLDEHHPEPEEPTVEDMVAVAKAYGKKPGYFVEYRARIIAEHFVLLFVANPEFSATVYRKVVSL